MITEKFYQDGSYLRNNPDWHASAAPWKTQSILQTLQRNGLTPHTICEIGCGAGEILYLLQQHLPETCIFEGYDIAPHAIELARKHENTCLRFHLADFLTAPETQPNYFDVLLLIDTLEHFENCFQVLREIKPKSQYKIFQLPLDISVVTVLRNQLIEFHYATGHLHFFTKDIALQMLREAGYEILDTFYTLPPLDMNPWSPKPQQLARKLVRVTKRGLQRLPGNLLYCVHHDLAVRFFGGWRLMVLAQ
ncbi:MAG TPA: methyltransferase domain-containing protein [Ktedonobacteraceae bacterium]|jgi:SAM-dependent methyltransferase